MKFAREIKAKAVELGFRDITIEQRGVHPMLRAKIRGRTIQFFFASSPSDRRAQKNNFALLRRLAKESPQ